MKTDMWTYTTQKMKFSIKDFFSKCDPIHRKLPIWSQLLKKSLMENFIFGAALHTLRGWKTHLKDLVPIKLKFDIIRVLRTLSSIMMHHFCENSSWLLFGDSFPTIFEDNFQKICRIIYHIRGTWHKSITVKVTLILFYQPSID